ncbi:MAG: T9SS type A sorting domain-containing protein [Candidatus Stahlbacteria bacterium]|nr:MAG: T9SS type A sorting domain-containing protein [Candidatus Stahlbacteria bacterium]
MKRFTLLLVMVAVLISTTAHAGWTKTYGGAGGEWGNSVQETTDGGYIIVGTDFAGTGREYDLWLLKTNSEGDTLWTRTYGKADWINDFGGCVRETSDGGYIILGSTQNSRTLPPDLWLIKTDEMGDTLWTQTHGGVFQDWGGGVQETGDGGYIIVGYTDLDPYNPVYHGDLWLVKTDALGDTLWTRTYGGDLTDVGDWVQETSDGGYIITGFTASFSEEQGPRQLWLLKTDKYGDTLWTRRYGAGNQLDEEGYCVRETSGGGYIISGSIGYNIWLLKTDEDGDTLWTRTYGRNFWDEGRRVEETKDGGYIVVGWSWFYVRGENDVWLLKTDENGDTLWTQLYGGGGEDFGYELDQTSDGGYIIVGSTESFGGGSRDLWLIKTDSLGNMPLEISCSKIIVPKEGADIDSMIPHAHFTNLSTKNYPKPFYCHCKITDFSFHSEVYHDSVLIQKGLNPWETVEKIEYTGVKFAEWKAEGISDYEAVFYATSAGEDSLPSRPRSVTFRCTSVREQPVAEPAADWEVVSSIGPQIILRYADQPQGFHASVFNAAGQKVGEMHSASPSGTITWPVTHHDFSPGVYFFRLESGAAHKTQKVILIR